MLTVILNLVRIFLLVLNFFAETNEQRIAILWMVILCYSLEDIIEMASDNG